MQFHSKREILIQSVKKHDVNAKKSIEIRWGFLDVYNKAET